MEKVLYCFYKMMILKNICESKMSQLCLRTGQIFVSLTKIYVASSLRQVCLMLLDLPNFVKAYQTSNYVKCEI